MSYTIWADLIHTNFGEKSTNLLGVIELQFPVEKAGKFDEHSIRKTAAALGISHKSCRLYEGRLEKVPRRLVLKGAVKEPALADSNFFY